MSGEELAVVGFLMIYVGGFGLGMIVLESVAHWLDRNRMLWAAPTVIVVCMLMSAMDRGVSI
jgi:hypothetical protein